MKRFIICYFCVLMVAAGCSKKSAEPVKPEILNVGPSQVTIAWLSNEPYTGEVFYKQTGGKQPFTAVKEQPGNSKIHEVTLPGLQPGTSYSYTVGKKGKKFHFRTQPPAHGAFSFMVAVGEVQGETSRFAEHEIYDFIIDAGPGVDKDAKKNPGAKHFTRGVPQARPYVPVFNRSGVDSDFQRALDNRETGPANPGGVTWALDWGGLRLIFLPGSYQEKDLVRLLSNPASHTFGIFTGEELTKQETIQASNLHKQLTAHNKNNADRIVGFVWLLGKPSMYLMLDGIGYFSPGTADTLPGGFIRVDVDVESTVAVWPGESKEIELRSPRLKGKRTCRECRRLADKGAYEKSIKAYMEFIDQNKGHYQIDDAYMAIAEIYDEKLFKFKEAVAWYNRLIGEYPEGNLLPLARQRLKYLDRFSDHEYKPLQQFERIRKIQFAREKNNPEGQSTLMKKVESIIREYPACNLAPVMQHWLANRYRLVSVEKAVQAYLLLEEKYGDSPEAKDTAVEIGETYYEAAMYDKAITAFEAALTKLPAREKTIRKQIDRAKRNRMRDTLATSAWIFLALLVTVTAVIKPRGLDFKLLPRCLWAFIVPAVLLAFGAWMIREQFSSTGEWLLLTGFLSLSILLGSFLSMVLVNKGSRPKATKIILGSLAGVFILIAGFYLTIFYINSHYLVVFKL